MDEKYVTKHDLYEKLWASRDFEINHLWQRSIFLATFIVALFTIYFSVLNNFTSPATSFEDVVLEVRSNESLSTASVIQNDEFSLVVKDDCDSKSLKEEPCFQLIALDVICLFGFLFSVLWICMAKGSKYMYERHERGIEAAHDKGSFDKELQREIDIESYEVLWDLGDYTYIPRHGALPLSDYDYRIFHYNGAKYSSSKINISIGYIFAVAWSALSILNGIIYSTDCKCINFVCITFGVLGLEIIFAFLLAYSILSDNSLSRWSFFCLTVRNVLSLYNPDNEQIKWIQQFIKSKRNNDPYSSIILHIRDVLNHYMNISDSRLERIILNSLVKELKTGRVKRKILRRMKSNEAIRNIFETALMYRDSFSDLFRYEWLDPIWSHNFMNIKEDGKSIEFIMNGIYREFSVANKTQPAEIPTIETRLYADTDWRRIRSTYHGYLGVVMHKLFNQQQNDYDLINNARTMHLISKEMNGSTTYMTLSFPDSISDKEFHYGEEPIPSDKFRILHVKYIEINKAYDKPISFEMDFIRNEKSDSDN